MWHHAAEGLFLNYWRLPVTTPPPTPASVGLQSFTLFTMVARTTGGMWLNLCAPWQTLSARVVNNLLCASPHIFTAYFHRLISFYWLFMLVMSWFVLLDTFELHWVHSHRTTSCLVTSQPGSKTLKNIKRKRTWSKRHVGFQPNTILIRQKPNIHQLSEFNEPTVVDTQHHGNSGAQREWKRVSVCVCVSAGQECTASQTHKQGE